MSPKSARRKLASRKKKAKQAKIKSKPLNKLIFLILSVIVFLVLPITVAYFLVIPHFLLSDQEPKRIAVTATSSNTADNHLLMITNENEKVDFFWIDGDESVEVSGDYGKYQIRSLVPLMIIEDKQDLLRPVLSHTLGFIVNGVELLDNWQISDDAQSPPQIEKLSKADQRQYLGWLFFGKAVKSWRNPEQALGLLRLHYYTKSVLVYSDDNIEQSNTYSIEDAADQLSGTRLMDAKLASSCPIAVINTTDTSGLANKIANLIEESGGVVIKVEHNDQKLPSSQLLIDENYQECQDVIGLSESLLPDNPQVEYLDSDTILSEHRSRIVLLLGENLAEY